MMKQLIQDYELFSTLFRGREDVFAIRWEKEGRSGYVPAYDLNWDEFAKHKANGGTLKDFQNKQYAPLTSRRIQNHFSGKEIIGIYPLQADNTSYFIAADFDETISSKLSWIDECRLLLEKLEAYHIPAYLERSRSGKGGHIWIFFDQRYPAFKSRKIMLHLLELAGIISPFDKNSNYDRLFPNQDYHSGRRLGNLISLPFQKQAMEQGNSCFIDPETEQPFSDQWEWLKTITRISVLHLEEIYNKIAVTSTSVPLQHSNNELSNDGIHITLSNKIVISRNEIAAPLVSFLRDNLNFINADYIVKKKLGKSTFGIEPYFKILTENNETLLLPRGFIGKLLRYCREEKIAYKLHDERKKLTEVRFNFKATLFEHQEEALEAVEKKDMGIVVAPPGSGKTIIGLAIATQKKQPALIIVHRTQLFEQWIERIKSFMGIAEAHVGKIAQGHRKIGTHITVAMIQSLAVVEAGSPLFTSFGTIIIDECHHVPAKTFRQVISQFSSYYLYGLTATPIRKNNDERLIFVHIGDVIYEIRRFEFNTKNKLAITIRETDLMIPFDFKTNDTETLYSVLIHDTNRNHLIAEDILAEVTAGRKVLVLTERKAHIEVLRQYLKSKCEVLTLSGNDKSSSQQHKLKQITDGQFQVLISTGQFLGEGIDIDKFNCLVLAYPFAFEGKLIQYIGRVQRTEVIPIIYDYRDIHVDFLEKQFRQRNRYYRQLMKTGQLQKFQQLLLMFEGDIVMINTRDVIFPITCLDIATPIEKFKTGIAWLVRVLDYNEEKGELITDIVNYNAKYEQSNIQQTELQFLIIEKIRFRAIDTGHLLRSVELKHISLSARTSSQPIAAEPEVENKTQPVIKPPEQKLREQIITKLVTIPFADLQFQQAQVVFSQYIESLGKVVNFAIENLDIRLEFEAIKEYFSKILRKKKISIQIEVRYVNEIIIAATAVSEYIDKINSSVIDSVRFEFVKRRILQHNDQTGDSKLNTIDTLLKNEQGLNKVFFKSEQDLIDDILSIKNSKHYHQLKYLSTKHLSSVLKLRFVLNPFSFLFLLAGDTKYHLVWETLNSEEASYIWHFEKNTEALRTGLIHVDAILKDIRATGKQDYLRKEHDHFSRVIHDYADAKSGFVSWKGILEGKLL